MVTEDMTYRVRAFWSQVNERQRMFVRRNRGDSPPWTSDLVLANHRFTNVYRASDRVSQYVINNVQRQGGRYPADVAFRTILFKLFNQIETYQYLMKTLGAVPSLGNWSVGLYGRLLDEAIREGIPIWNNAYMITPPKTTYGGVKHHGWLHNLKLMTDDGLFHWITEETPTLDVIYKRLLTYPTVGSFFAFQWTIDLNCYLGLDENSFVVAGLGAVRGAQKLFGPSRPDFTPEHAIYMLTNTQEEHLPADFPWLGGSRHLHLIDVQNCLCEFDKHTRVSHPDWSLGGSTYQKIKQGFDSTVALRNERIYYSYPVSYRITNQEANRW